MAHFTDIPFQEIPRQSTIFLQYLQKAPAALSFYQHAATPKDLEAVGKQLKSLQFPRSQIASILRRQNKSYGCDAITLSQINELEKTDCVAVVTGQQVGIFTGPLYTIYKALTAIHLAEEIKKLGMPAVPIFWMDSEDHDLAEVTHRNVLNSDWSLKSIDFKDILFGELSAGSVGPIRFPEKILQAIPEFLSHIPESDGKAEVRLQLESACRPGSTFSQSFAELLLKILSGAGLILFDPHDFEVKHLVAGVFQSALRNADVFHAALLRRNQELESAGFHAQVTVLENSTVLFLEEHGERRALEKRDSEFGLRHTGSTFTFDTLLDCAEHAPERFSPNVLLRPLVQDSLFPTVAYVGGSSELAYFAQIEVLYRLYDRPMPVLWPRNSFTLIDPEIGAEMDRLGVEIRDCFHGPQFLMEKMVRNSGFSHASSDLEDLQLRLDRSLTEMKPDLQSVEPPLADALETSRRKILHNIQHLKSQILRLEGTRNSSLLRTAEMVTNYCYPSQTLQEREFGIQFFLARYGARLLNEIRSAIDVSNFAHRVVRL